MRGDTVFVGDVGLDEYFEVARWPEHGTKVEAVPLTSHVGGMVANAACVYAALGATAEFCWSMRPGPLTDMLLADLKQHGVDIRHVSFDPALSDARSLVILAGGEHTLLYTRTGLTAIELGPHTMKAMCEASYVYTAIGDLRLLRHGELGVGEVLDALRTAGTDLVLDLDVAELEEGDEDLIGQVNLLFVNRVGMDRLRAGRTENEVVAGLLAGSARAVVVTLAGGGCRVHLARETISVAGVQLEPVDVTGAGDTFCATFLYVFHHTEDALTAAQVANAAAARSVLRSGARSGVAPMDDVLAFMGDRAVVSPDRLASLAAALP